MHEIHIIETVICDICHSEIEIDEAREVLTSTFICDPDLVAPQCLWHWNNESYMRSEFYD